MTIAREDVGSVLESLFWIERRWMPPVERAKLTEEVYARVNGLYEVPIVPEGCQYIFDGLTYKVKRVSGDSVVVVRIVDGVMRILSQIRPPLDRALGAESNRLHIASIHRLGYRLPWEPVDVYMGRCAEEFIHPYRFSSPGEA